MNRNFLARALAILLLGIVFASYINHDRQKWRRLGRDAYAAHEMERFDRLMTPTVPAAATAIGAIIVAAFVFGLYELVVLGLSAILKSSAPAQQSPPGSQNVPFS